MLTEIDEIGGFFLGDLVPSTVDFDASPDDMNTNLFFDQISENKNSSIYTDSYKINNNTFESQSDHMSSGSPVDDLLDLEDIQASWRSETSDPDPDWTPQLVNLVAETKKSVNTVQPTHKERSLAKLTTSSSTISQVRPAKRRSTSSTSELEIQIEIEESTKRAKRCTASLTEEEKKVRRKELNRLAAQRCRSKRKGHAEILEQEIEDLTVKNKELKERLEKLTSTKDELYEVIKFHFSKCHGGNQTAATSSGAAASL